MEVLVTQGDTIYISEAENVCSRTLESKQMYVQKLLQDHSSACNSDSAYNNSCTVSAHPLLDKARLDSASNKNKESVIAQLETGASTVETSGSETVESETQDEGNETKVTQSPIVPMRPEFPHSQLNSQHHQSLHGHQNQQNQIQNQNQQQQDNTSNNNNNNTNRNGFFDPLLRPPVKLTQLPPWSSSLLVLIPLRLGIHTVNTEYVPVRCLAAECFHFGSFSRRC